jgi:hypothetical protein
VPDHWHKSGWNRVRLLSPQLGESFLLSLRGMVFPDESRVDFEGSNLQQAHLRLIRFVDHSM